MCGIWEKQEVNLERQMLDNRVYRGPDDRGLFSKSHGAPGHNRLSIMEDRPRVYSNHLNIRGEYL